jgi:hypothetical protein
MEKVIPISMDNMSQKTVDPASIEQLTPRRKAKKPDPRKKFDSTPVDIIPTDMEKVFESQETIDSAPLKQTIPFGTEQKVGSQETLDPTAIEQPALVVMQKESDEWLYDSASNTLVMERRMNALDPM